MILDHYPRAMVLVAILSVIITWFAVTRLSTFFGLEQRLILVIAPLASLAVAIGFLYIGRSRLRFPADRTPDQFEMNNHPLPSMPKADTVIAAEPNGMDTVAESPEEPAEVISVEPFSNVTVAPSPEEPREVMLASPSTQSAIAASPEAQGTVMVTPPVQDTIAASPQAQSTAMVGAPAPSAITASPEAQSTAIVGAPVHSTVVAEEIPASVEKVMQEIEKRSELRCLVITAPSHGVLQDRLNNWLSGKYGRVVSSSMATSEKGFYMALFYEPSPLE